MNFSKIKNMLTNATFFVVRFFVAQARACVREVAMMSIRDLLCVHACF
jgi:hypothetical protein